MVEINLCFDCGFWDHEREGCSCPSFEMWYACPIQSKKEENQKELVKYGEWLNKKSKGGDNYG